MCTRKHRADSRWLTTAHINDANQSRRKCGILLSYPVTNVCHCLSLLNPPSIGSRLPSESGSHSQEFFATGPNVYSYCRALIRIHRYLQLEGGGLHHGEVEAVEQVS